LGSNPGLLPKRHRIRANPAISARPPHGKNAHKRARRGDFALNHTLPHSTLLAAGERDRCLPSAHRGC